MNDTQRKPTVLIWAHNTTNLGELKQGADAARGLTRRGFHVVLASSDKSLADAQNMHMDFGEDVTFLPLPAAIPPGGFETASVEGRFREMNAYYPMVQQARTQRLLDALNEHRPDIIITQRFPAGKGRYEPELTALLKAAEALPDRPLKFAMDWGQVLPRDQEEVDRFHRLMPLYDGWLTVGELFQPHETMPNADKFYPINQTFGYFTNIPEPKLKREGQDSIVYVSFGGSKSPGSDALIEGIIAARAHSPTLQNSKIVLSLNPKYTETDRAAIQSRIKEALSERQGDGTIVIEGERSGTFEEALQQASLVICAGGGNTLFAQAAMKNPTISILRGPEDPGVAELAQIAQRLEERGFYTAHPADLPRDPVRFAQVIEHEVARMNETWRANLPTLQMNGATAMAESLWQRHIHHVSDRKLHQEQQRHDPVAKEPIRA